MKTGLDCACRKRQCGAALMEIMLAVVIAGMVIASLSPMVLRRQDQVSAQATANEFSAFRAAAVEFFKWKRTEFLAAMKDGTGADALCMVNVAADGSGGQSTYSAALHRCALDTSMMRYLNVLPTSIPLNNRYGERWVAIFKLVYDTQTPPQPTGGVEMMVLSARVDGAAPLVPADPRAYDEAVTAAGFASGQGGVIPDADRSTCVASRSSGKYESCGVGYRVNLNQFLESGEVSAFASRLNN